MTAQDFIRVPSSIPSDPWDAATVWPWYKRRLIKGGVWVACSFDIVSERDKDGKFLCDQRLIAETDGDLMDVSTGNPPGWPWTPILKSEYDFLKADAAWARMHASHVPAANPKKRISIEDALLPF